MTSYFAGLSSETQLGRGFAYPMTSNFQINMTPKSSKNAYLEFDIVVSTKEKRDGVSLTARFVDGTVNSRFEDIICACISYWCVG